ncbi:hypothetical protein V495_03648 [Pseudogymnoascus sp. VKM F-4514 (FW-929)]|nr:hypothetical protein V495_03648 [Pseudogymnoascus sp. VKM F-4514 (FW-929)]
MYCTLQQSDWATAGSIALSTETFGLWFIHSTSTLHGGVELTCHLQLTASLALSSSRLLLLTSSSLRHALSTPGAAKRRGSTQPTDDMAYVQSVIPLVVTSLLFTIIAGILVLTRVITRARIGIIGIDDYLSLGALCASILFCVVVFQQIKYGLGTPFATIPLENIPVFVKCLWGTIPCYNTSLILTKLSIIFQYKRIFTTPMINRLCNIMLGVLVVYGLWTIVGSIVMCIPVAAFWDESIKGHCMNRLQFWFANAGVNIATDIIIFAIPMPLLKQLQLPKKQKIGLMFVFGFGAFVCVTSIIRLKSLYEISVSPDTALDGVNAGIWSGIEINVALACASLPAIKPLIAKFVPHFLSSRAERSTRHNNPSGGYDHALSELSHKQRSRVGGRSALDDEEEGEGITVERTVRLQRHQAPRVSGEGSERSLVNWKADVYTEERNEKEVV